MGGMAETGPNPCDSVALGRMRLSMSYTGLRREATPWRLGPASPTPVEPTL